MNGTRLLVAGVVLATVPIAHATPDTTGCVIHTAVAITDGTHYVYGIQEVWEESNGIPGLQRHASYCPMRESLPADTCVTHMENWRLVSCLASYPTTLNP